MMSQLTTMIFLILAAIGWFSLGVLVCAKIKGEI